MKDASYSPTLQNSELLSEWLKGLGDFDPTPYKHIEQIISGFEDLDAEEKDKFQWIMKSDELRQWQRCTSSTILDVRPEDAPGEDINPLSLASAVIQATLDTIHDLPVLSFFCGLRSTDSRHPDDSGPMALLNSFNAQLLKFLAEKRADADLSFLNQREIKRKSKDEPKYALKLLDECLHCLPGRDIVVMIIDSLSRLTGDKNKGHRIITRMADTITEYPHLIIKILITDALPTCPSKDVANQALFVPSEIDGDRNGVDLEVLKDESRDRISDFEAKRQKETNPTKDSEESDDSDDW
jgi:hypothetical protein